ncbi:hypothetical protein ONZ45_g6266 [Pleurotus djamor]|nr:hypothetical protein ONZ45_g6266 [Pleurotus djamor]
MATPLVGVSAALSGQPPSRTIFSQFSLENKVALVTGGQRGLGLEVALGFAEAELPPLDMATDTKKARLEYISADVTDQLGIWKVAEEIVAKEGRLDICFANAGIVAVAGSLEFPADKFTEVINVNVNGALYTAQAAGRQMEKLGISGSIIFMASICGSVAFKQYHSIAYHASKSALLQMARSMASELGPKGIRVNSLSPGYIRTKLSGPFLDESGMSDVLSAQNPLSRLGRPDELRGVCLWLASDASSFCTGSNIVVDGGHLAW